MDRNVDKAVYDQNEILGIKPITTANPTTRVQMRHKPSTAITASWGMVIPRIRLLFCLVRGRGVAGLVSRGMACSDAVSSVIAKSRSAGLNGFASSDASKIARARETSCCCRFFRRGGCNRLLLWRAWIQNMFGHVKDRFRAHHRGSR